MKAQKTIPTSGFHLLSFPCPGGWHVKFGRNMLSIHRTIRARKRISESCNLESVRFASQIWLMSCFWWLCLFRSAATTQSLGQAYPVSRLLPSICPRSSRTFVAGAYHASIAMVICTQIRERPPATRLPTAGAGRSAWQTG